MTEGRTTPEILDHAEDRLARPPQTMFGQIPGLFRARRSSSTDSGVRERNHGLAGLQIYAFVLLVIPSNIIIEPAGGAAYPAGLIALGLLAFWVFSTLSGNHDPKLRPTPIRLSFVVVWAVTLLSYTVMAMALPPEVQVNSADRWILELAGWTGVALVAADSLRSPADFRSLIRAIAWGASIMGIVAMLQFWAEVDLSETLGRVPGFVENFETTGISSREAVNRVAGTAAHPIELGVVAATLLPILAANGIYDRERSPASRWIPVFIVAMCIPISVSRSAILAVVISMGVFIPFLRPRYRVQAFAAVLAAALASFLTARGIVSTIYTYLFLGSSDPSISAREADVPLVERMLASSPWVGHGPGTHVPGTQSEILDNQYFGMLIETGIIGTVAITLAYLLLPAVVAFSARRRITDEGGRALGAALGSSVLVGLAVAATFDSLRFPMYGGVFALVLGIIGAYWRWPDTRSVERPSEHGFGLDGSPEPH